MKFMETRGNSLFVLFGVGILALLIIMEWMTDIKLLSLILASSFEVKVGLFFVVLALFALAWYLKGSHSQTAQTSSKVVSSVSIALSIILVAALIIFGIGFFVLCAIGGCFA